MHELVRSLGARAGRARRAAVRSTQHLAAPRQLLLALPRARSARPPTFSPSRSKRRDRVSTTLRIVGSCAHRLEDGPGARVEAVVSGATGKAHQWASLGCLLGHPPERVRPASGRWGRTLRPAARPGRAQSRAGSRSSGETRAMLARIRSIGASGAASRSQSGHAAKPGTSRGFSARKLRLTSGKPARDEVEGPPRVQRVERVQVRGPGVELEARVHQVAADADLVLVDDELLGALSADGVEPEPETLVVEDRPPEHQEVRAEVQVVHLGPAARSDQVALGDSSSGIEASVAHVVLVELHRRRLQAPPVAGAARPSRRTPRRAAGPGSSCRWRARPRRTRSSRVPADEVPGQQRPRAEVVRRVRDAPGTPGDAVELVELAAVEHPVGQVEDVGVPGQLAQVVDDVVVDHPVAVVGREQAGAARGLARLVRVGVARRAADRGRARGPRAARRGGSAAAGSRPRRVGSR